ncbi:class I SAM-dependent methyltransferase [Corynebacterium cystitidis]|uniref:Methyltransferase domain-containing protein n=1 Tax=Corynebacterium cystitidis DSM 20524 TaxID=1121357 RepID=A0A1H9QSL7_9CORY|nr:class I SAM-dependent methyltransferase [Corynebacterium cystitidis]WJY81693.1 Malonyl-[acyl-carrier protein] O-methyltransferase [Corynebacterium cystitidis DSM 20524]SER62829.1 Methyltransferase domain-containing protein [Corynebacterium cystitidis DSM 20524]SNV84814.1 SAM-dependent methyltransferase [Corynebacterium cystitidis]
MLSDADISNHWSGRAAEYHEHHLTKVRFPHYREAWTKVLIQALPPPPARILDAGTGPGYVAELCSDIGYEVVGIDIAPGMLELARKNYPHLEFIETNVVNPQVEGVFDAVVARYVLWTLTDPQRALTRWMELIPAGGLIVAIDANWHPGGQQTEDQRYNADDLAALPLATATSPEPYVELFTRVGLENVTCTELTEIGKLNEIHKVPVGQHTIPQYVFIGRKPK